MELKPEFYKLSDADEFEKRFIELTRQTDTYEEAYNRVEKEYKKAYPKKGRRYSSYTSFRVTRAKKHKNKKGADG